MARREEWWEQVKLARLLGKWLDPASSFWTATDPVAPSALSGAMRKKRGVAGGTGRAGLALREIDHPRAEIAARAVQPAAACGARGAWRARSGGYAARPTRRWALAQSGVQFRTIVHEDGTVERWQQPELPAWEVPKRNPRERRPRAPKWEPQTAAAEIAEFAAERGNAAAA